MNHSVTLELPDNLYQKLHTRSQQANRSLEDELLTTFAVDLPVLPPTETPIAQTYNGVMDFLASGPTPFEIIQFRLPDHATERVQWLLDKEREQSLTEAEAQELDAHVALGDFLGILRAKVQLRSPTGINNSSFTVHH